MAAVNINNYIDELVECLKTLNPVEIILFGSVAKGQYDSQSDIDLLIVLDFDLIPQTYEDKMKMKLEVRRAVRHINRKVAIDFLVFTKKEYDLLQTEKSSLIDEINNTGRVLYEKAG